MFDYIYNYYRENVFKRKGSRKEWMFFIFIIIFTVLYLLCCLCLEPRLMIISFITILVTMYGWNSYEKHEMVNNAEDVKETYDKKIEPLAKMLQDKGMYNVESLQWIDRECEKKLKKENKMTIVSSFANTAIWPLVISIVTVSVEDVDIAILTRVCVIWVLLMSIFLIFILLVYSDMDMLINRKKKVLERLQTDIEYIYSQYDQLWKYQRSEEKIECCDE